MWNNGNQGYGNQGYGNEGSGNQGYFPTPGGPPPPPSGFNFPSPDPYRGGPPPMPPRPMDSSPGQMPSPGQWGSPPVPSPYGDSPSPGNRGFGSSGSGGFAGSLLNSAVSKAASKAGVNFTPPGFSPPAGPPSGAGYQSPSGPPPGYGGGRDHGSGPSPNSVYNFNGPSSNTSRPQEYRQPSFPFQQPGEYHMPPSQAQYYGPQMSTPGGEQQQPSFLYSQCTGKKKALIIGINYIGTEQELGGCINDARNMKNFIIRNYGYKDENVVMLTDDAQNPVQRPTRSNIIRAMEWLVRYAESNDSLFFHYSGHGGLTKDTDGDEEDGWDEVIYPVDHHETDHIVDDEMHEIMVRPLPTGCRLTAIFDSCHSGSALDLPYVYSTEGKIKEPNLYAEAGSSLIGAATAYAKKDYGGVLKGITGLAKAVSGSQGRAEKKTRQTRSSAADVISWSGCKDSQTSADTQVAGQGTGAMSWAFTESLTENKQQSYQQLLITIRSKLKAKYSQKPQLSSSHPMDTNILFIL